MARTKKLDFTGVESYSKASEGIHTAKVVEIQEKKSQGGDDMLQFAFEVIKGDDKGCKVYESFVLTDKALWKLKAFLQAVGVKAEGKIKLDLDKLVGKICDIEVFWEEYNGQNRAKIADYYKAGKGGKSEDIDEDDDTDDADDEDDDDEEEAPKKAKKPAAKGRGKKKPEPEPEDDDDDDDDADDEDEEEEEKPAKKGRKAKATKAKGKAASKSKGKKKPDPEEDEDEDDDGDDEWEEDDD